MSLYDCIVIGAGIEGSATAYSLAKAGKNTLVLEQFPLGHARGSSHGHTRILRKAYPPQHWYYSNMVEESIPKWRQLEKESGLECFRQTGTLSVGLDPARIDQACKTMASQGIDHTRLSNEVLREKYPMIDVPKPAKAFYEREGGVIFADRALAAFQGEFRKLGGQIRDVEKVVDITPGYIITVTTNRGRSYKAKSLVITAGPWAKTLVKPLGIELKLEPWRVSAMYWKQKVPGMFDIDRFPCLRFMYAMDGHNLYGIPSYEYPGLFKLCHHVGHVTDPDSRDLEEFKAEEVKAKVGRFIKEHLPQLEDTPSIVESCFYTMAPNEDYILDTHPKWKNIVIGAGFSGHGFKLSPVIGQILSELANGKKPGRDMSHFSLENNFKLQARL